MHADVSAIIFEFERCLLVQCYAQVTWSLARDAATSAAWRQAAHERGRRQPREVGEVRKPVPERAAIQPSIWDERLGEEGEAAPTTRGRGRTEMVREGA